MSAPEPRCPCGSDMISYAGGPPWECAEAYFTLKDDDVIYDDGATPPRLRECDPGYVVADRRMPTDYHREVHAHLVATRIASSEALA